MSEGPEAGLAGIGQIALTVRDLQRATGFYRETLGLPFLFDVPGRMSFFDCGGVRLMLGLSEGPEAAVHPSGTILYFRVNDIERTHRILEARGVEFVSPPHRVAELETHDLWLAFFPDPDGTVLALMSEVARR
jgi:catechol 2,3-dioxygenase-like lactoylglutathione lyase family enzyme